MIRFGYFDEDNFMIVRFLDNISRNEIIDLIQYTRDGNHQKVLVDMTSANLQFSEDEARDIGEFWSGIVKHPVKMVLLVADSKATAMSFWFNEHIHSGLIDIRVFSTLLASISFLKLNMTIKELRDKTQDLEFEFSEDALVTSGLILPGGDYSGACI